MNNFTLILEQRKDLRRREIRSYKDINQEQPLHQNICLLWNYTCTGVNTLHETNRLKDYSSDHNYKKKKLYTMRRQNVKF